MSRICALLLVVSAFGCSSSSSGGTTPTPEDSGGTSGTEHAVEVNDFSFSPQTLTIKAGDKVTWTWKAGTHSVTSGASCTSDGKFDSTLKGTPNTFSQTFTTAGSFPYYCIAHCGMGMTGTITVTP